MKDFNSLVYALAAVQGSLEKVGYKQEGDVFTYGKQSQWRLSYIVSCQGVKLIRLSGRLRSIRSMHGLELTKVTHGDLIQE